MKNIRLFMLVFFGFPVWVTGQYAPPAGQPGTTAISNDSSIFVAWATGCQVVRGPVDITDPQGEKASYGDETDALGPAEGTSADVVSLGDGGKATLTFDVPVADGEGWDFAVFENALNDTFLELAFVQVSSNGADFYTFPSVSLTDTNTQVPAFGEIDCTKIYNLAGKYRQGYGTPFDLAQLKGTGNLDLNHITHIRVIDVTGCIQEPYASRDSLGHAINDPWPTPFWTCGFDLDGIGVIHTANSGTGSVAESFLVYPNPFSDRFTVIMKENAPATLGVYSQQGVLTFEKSFTGNVRVDLSSLASGVYFLKIVRDKSAFTRMIVKL